MARALSYGADRPPTVEALRERAYEAWQVVGADVPAARELAESVVSSTQDAEAQSVALRVLGLVAIELSDAASCLTRMEAALRAARRTGEAVLVAHAEIGVAVAHQYLGDRPAALRWASKAVRRAPLEPRIALSRGVILERFGDTDEALAMYDRAEVLARRSGDAAALSRMWCNRGVLLIYRGDLHRARSDLEAADAITRESGLDHVGVVATANLAFLAAREGNVVEALARLEAATPAIEALGGLRLGVHELDRCETLLLAGLFPEAMGAAAAAIDTFAEAGLVVEQAESRIAFAQAALLNGEYDQAQTQAELALKRLRQNRSGLWAVLAEEALVQARWAKGQREASLAVRAGAVASSLAVAGMPSAAASARILAARIELGLGRRAQAEAQLRLVNDTPRSPVGLRVQARCATALLRRASGDRRGARAALRSGWALLERHRATLGATELRAGATAHVAEVVAIGLEMAIEDRRPREVLQWAERGRVGALTPRATAPPEDPELATLLGELRVVAAEADAAAKRGDDNRALLRRQATVEERVRSRARLLPPDEGGAEPPTAEPATLLRHLGPRALIEYVVSGGDMWAVVAASGRFSLRRICTEPQIADEVDGLRVALRRLAFGSPVPQLRVAARDAAEYARGRLAQLLFEPIADLVGDRTRVIVPMGVLHAVPWSALAEDGAGHVVAPSASLWARAAARAPEAAGDALLVAGPRLAEADSEVRAIEQLVPGASALTGEAATVDAVREAMAGASLAHLACHGRFRADNPLFSSLELHDGALSVFELERLGRAPEQIILSACDAGLSAVHPGDELLGLAAALLRLGTTGIVASVLPVPDESTRRLMVALHEALAAGHGLADALAAARTRLDPERDDDLVASWAFQVFGAG